MISPSARIDPWMREPPNARTPSLILPLPPSEGELRGGARQGRRKHRCSVATMPMCSRPRSSAGRSPTRRIPSWRGWRSPGWARTPERARSWAARRSCRSPHGCSDSRPRRATCSSAIPKRSRRWRTSPRASREALGTELPGDVAAHGASAGAPAVPPAGDAPDRRPRPRRRALRGGRRGDQRRGRRVPRARLPATGTRSSRSASSGGRELNYASDVDLLLLHRDEVGGTAPRPRPPT